MNFEALAWDGLEAWRRDKPSAVAIDTETHGFSWHDRPFCVTVAWRGNAGYEGHYFELEEYDSSAELREILHGTPTWAFHNAKFDLQKLLLVGLISREDITPERIEDTEALAHLLDENRPKGLKALAVSVLGYDDTIEVPIKSGPRAGQMRKVSREKYELDAARKKLKVRKEEGYGVLPREVVIPYAVKDAEFTIQLYDLLAPSVRASDDLSALYDQEMALTLVLLDMEAAGMAVDVEYLERTSKDYFNRITRAEGKLRLLSGEEDFNPGSPAQVKAVFVKRGLNVKDTQEETLSKLDDDFARVLLDYRHLKKIHSTYLIPLLREQRDGIVHVNIRQHGARTGRTSSGSYQGD